MNKHNNEDLLGQIKTLQNRIAELELTAQKWELHADGIKYHATFIDNIMNSIADPVFVKDEYRRFVMVNDALCAIVGRSRDKLLGEDGDDMFPEEQVKVFKKIDTIVLNTGKENTNEENLTDLSTGNVHTIITRKTLYTNPSGKRFIVGVIRDVTDSKRTDELLRLQEDIMKNIAEGVYFIRLDDGIIVYANTKFEKMFGYDHGEIIGKDVSIVNAPTQITPDAIKNGIIECIRKTGEWHGDIENIKKDGTRFWCHANVSVFYHPEYGKLMISIHTDITERKRIDGEKARLLSIIEESPDFVGTADLHGNLLYHNKGAKRMIGLPEDADLSHMKIGDMHPSGSGKLVMEEGIPAILNRGSWKSDNILLHRDGREIPVSQILVLHRDSSGKPEFVSTIMHNISDRKKMEKGLVRYKTLFDSSRDAIMTLEPPAWTFTSGNPATVEMFGARDEAEFIAKGPWELSPEFQPDGKPSSEKAREMISKAMEEGSNFFEWTHKRIGGQSFPATVLLTRVEAENGKPFLQATVRDITEQEKIKKSLLESEERFLHILYSSKDAILLIDNEKFVDCNDAATRMLEYPDKGSFLMTHSSELSPPVQPDGKKSFEKANEMIKAAYEVGFHRFRWMYKKASGDIFPVEVSLTPISFRGKSVLHCIWRDLTETVRIEEKERKHLRNLEVFSKACVGREVRILDLKKEMESLKAELSKLKEGDL